MPVVPVAPAEEGAVDQIPGVVVRRGRLPGRIDGRAHVQGQRLALRRDAVRLVGKGRLGQDDFERLALRGQAHSRAVDGQDLGALDLQADRGGFSAWFGLQAPERVPAIQHQVDAGVEIDVTDAAVHRHIRPPLGRVVAEEVADGGGQRIERLDLGMRVRSDEAKFDGNAALEGCSKSQVSGQQVGPCSDLTFDPLTLCFPAR